MNKTLAVLGLAGLLSAAGSLQAQPYYVSGSGLTPPWTPGTAAFEMLGGPTVYTLSTATVTNAYHNFKVTGVTWGDPNFPGNDVQAKGDANGSNTFYFFPGTTADGWSPLANRVGYADPGNMAFEVAGDFTTPAWGSDPASQLTSAGNGLYTNTYIVATAGTHYFKFRTPNTWNEVRFGSDFGNNGGDASFITTSANEAILFKLDLPNGRWQAGGPPVFCNVQFSVDMSLVRASDAGFDPASVTVNGGALAPYGWGGTVCTNNPTAANTNIYTSPYFSISAGTATEYQFRYVSSGNTQYDARGGIGGQNRTLTVPNMSSTNIPTVYWNDALPTDLLNVDTAVTFTIDMNGAAYLPTPLTGFNPSADYVYVNGDFQGWLGWDPISLTGSRLTENPPGSSIYQLTIIRPAGSSRAMTYKYAVNGSDNEAGFAQNHFRYIRGTNGTYNLPMDTFATQYSEPKVGGLTIAPPSVGALPINWLSYPNVNLQVSSNLTSWQDVANTMGASATNWPAGGGPRYFRLVQH